MYKITARDLEGFKATHTAWTMRAAMEWLASYPAHVACFVTIDRFGKRIASRYTAVSL